MIRSCTGRSCGNSWEGRGTDPAAGTAVADGSGNKYTVTSNAADTVAFTGAVNKKSATVPDTVTAGGKTYKVTEIKAKAFAGKKIRTVTVGRNVQTIGKNAFKGSKATKLVVGSMGLSKASVKESLKGSKVKTVQVKVGKKAVNKKYVKKYKKIFTKKNAGKKVRVK